MTGLLAQTPVGELMPLSVIELIRSQLARLTPSAWALLVAGAVLGQGLTFERLIEVAQLDEQQGLRASEELLRSGLLCEGTLLKESQAFVGYAFPREMIREVVYQEAGATRRRLMQRRASMITSRQTFRELFLRCDESEANLSNSDLNGADMTGAHLQGADLRKALMNWPSLEGELIHLKQLNQAKEDYDGL